jgi:hypothetical protein
MTTWLGDVKGWLDGKVDLQVIEASHPMANAILMGAHMAGTPADETLLDQLFSAACPGGGEAERRAFDEARGWPPEDIAVAFALAGAYAARDGWLSYYAHRGMIMPTTFYAAQSVQRVARAGHVTWAEVVAWARALVRSDQPSMRSST